MEHIKTVNISVVIRCCNDWRVFRTIESIDVRTEIIVSICCGQELKRKLADQNIIVVEAPHGNLSITSNNGITKSSYKKIILVDSDTRFNPNSILRTYYLLNSYDVLDLEIKFFYTSNSQKIVAKAREFVNSLAVAFTPGIALNKSIISKIGGYVFNTKIPFAVDAEFNYRVQKYDLKTGKIKSAIIHDSISIRHDLKAARRIGRGCRIGQDELKENVPEFELKAVRPIHYPLIIKEKGISVLLYQLMWDISFFIGYITNR